MGLYNLPGQNIISNQNLANNICPICENPGIRPQIDGGDRDSYDYICNHCNPNTIICIGGSTLVSPKLGELAENPAARERIKNDIGSTEGSHYILTTSDIDSFL